VSVTLASDCPTLSFILMSSAHCRATPRGSALGSLKVYIILS
jgi:hypothetical protein